FKEIIRRPCLQFFQRLTRNAGLRFPVIASVLRLVRLVHESKRVKHVKSSPSKACRRRQGFRELDRVCDPRMSCQKRADAVRIRLSRGWIWSHRLQKLEGLLGRTREKERGRQRNQIRGCAIGQIESCRHGDRGGWSPGISRPAV